MEDEFTTDNKAVTQQRDNNGKFVKGNTCGFQPGEVSNPLGAPKKEDCLVMCIKEELLKLSENKVSLNAEIIASILVKMAKQGKLKAIEMSLDYVSGKPSQSINLSTKEPMIIKVINA